MGYTLTLPNLLLSLIDIRTQDAIAISDLSSYLTVPDSAHLSLQITIPGGQVANNVTFVPQNVNVYKCADLGITCGDDGCTPLPDGIYEVVYTVVGATQANSVQTTQTVIDQKFIKIDHIKCKYQHAFLKEELSCMGMGPACATNTPGVHRNNYPWSHGPMGLSQLQQVKLYIDGSVAACNEGNYAMSWELYQRANKMLDRMGCNKFIKGGLWCHRPVVCDIC